MKRKLLILSLLLIGSVPASKNAGAQTIAYRQTNLASDVGTPGFANQVNLAMGNSWGIAFLPGQPFFITNVADGRVTVHDASGASPRPVNFTVPNPDGLGADTPTGIAADTTSSFGSRALIQPFIMATENGRLFFWGPDQNGNILPEATLARDHASAGAVYTGVAILTPGCCAPFLAVANFHTGLVETYNTTFSPLAASGSFTDPNLPPGYAPYGMQVIGNELFVTYALQDAAKHDPVFGAGNGIVSVFDLEGNFVRRFVTGGPLDAPWGIAQASAGFGPFSKDILIGNAGDGTIHAFDPATGVFAGQIEDGDGKAVSNSGLHALAFRLDGFGNNPNTLYFTAGINDGQDGLFGAISAGLVSATRLTALFSPNDGTATFTASVAADPGNVGVPTGTVSFADGGTPLGSAPVLNGVATLESTLSGIGLHTITAQFSGDATFLPSSSETEVQVSGPTTALTLAAPASATPGTPLVLTATINSEGGIPTGQILFFDGNAGLGAAPLDEAGVAVLRIDALAVGIHSLVASYPGDGKFTASTSAPAAITIASKDFSIGAAPPATTVTAGQQAVFSITVTPAGGFSDQVTFSCPPIAGITCSFNPTSVVPNGRAGTTVLTVSTSAETPRSGRVAGGGVSSFPVKSLGLLWVALLLGMAGGRRRIAFLRVAASALTVMTLALALASCGGGAANGQASRNTASIVVTAQSGIVSHTTSVSVTVQ